MTNQKSLDTRECGEFLMVLQHKSKLHTCTYRELKQEVEFEEYLEYVKGAPLDSF